MQPVEMEGQHQALRLQPEESEEELQFLLEQVDQVERQDWEELQEE
jgi:hypothetical protein